MADLVITANDVIKTGSGQQGTAGEAITAGQALYSDAATSGVLRPADATTADKAALVGIALNNAATGQPVSHSGLTGTIDVGAVLVVGEVYVVSATPGGGNIAPISDLGSTEFVTVIGVATAADALQLSAIRSGVAKP